MTDSEIRAEIKRILPLLSDGNRDVFMRLYSPNNLTKDINHVVDELTGNQLKHALFQAQNTYYKIFKLLKT